MNDSTSINTDVSSLTSEELFDLVMRENSVPVLKTIARFRFSTEAQVMNDNKNAPFILWPAINQKPQPWLAALTGSIAKHELQLSDNNLTILCVPSSASWYQDTLKKIFPNAVYPRVTKHPEENLPLPITLEVPSYVHNRNMDGTRGTNTMYFYDRELYKPQGTTLIVDDALAEGYTAIELAKFLKNQFAQDTIYFASPLAKQMQGGIIRLKKSSLIKGMSIVITVTNTQGKGKPIQFV